MGSIAYAKGFGVTTVGTDEPVTPESLFQIMDTGRPLVTVAVMQLVAQGKVDLDAPITDYLPYFDERRPLPADHRAPALGQQQRPAGARSNVCR